MPLIFLPSGTLNFGNFWYIISKVGNCRFSSFGRGLRSEFGVEFLASIHVLSVKSRIQKRTIFLWHVVYDTFNFERLALAILTPSHISETANLPPICTITKNCQTLLISHSSESPKWDWSLTNNFNVEKGSLGCVSSYCEFATSTSTRFFTLCIIITCQHLISAGTPETNCSCRSVFETAESETTSRGNSGHS